MNIKTTDYDFMREAFKNGIISLDIGERLYIKVSNKQLSASAPDFVTEEDGKLKDLIYSEVYQDGTVIMINAIKKVDGILVGDPWENKMIPEEKVLAYCDHYGYDNLVFTQELIDSRVTEEI